MMFPPTVPISFRPSALRSFSTYHVIVFATLACLSTKQPVWTAAVAWCKRLVSNSSDALPLRCVACITFKLSYVTLPYLKLSCVALRYASSKAPW